jgi:DNA repair exonuclease SbcCD ATPase subunit
MYIHFSKVRYKNILSVGNQFIEIPLDTHHTTLITGKNGSSKSTVIEAIVFCLYNKPFRKINKPQLINSINQKELLVELEFQIAADRYLLRRGMKPNIFEIWKNNELINKDAASRDYQLYLEQNILRMSFKSFSQIVILGSATYVPFMELPAAQRREVIEDLLDIQVFSTMNTLLKDRISENKNSITENNYSIDLLKTKIEAAEEHNAEIERMKRVEVEKLKTKVSDNVNKIETNNQTIEHFEEQINIHLKTIEDKPKQRKLLEQLKTLQAELLNKKKQLEKEITFYSNHDNCPTCKQGIQHDFKETIVSEQAEKMSELEDALDQLGTRLTNVETRMTEISVIEDQINELHSKANEVRIENKMIMNQLKTYKKDLLNAEKEVDTIDQSKILDYMSELKILQTAQKDLYDHRETLSVVASMLKDGGIKTSIIKTYIPIMNKLINQYLADFELFVDFNLDENFNETIKSRFRDTFTFASFSEGEKLRITLSILFTWRTVSKLRNSASTNLLIADETLDGPADASGIESIIEVLNKINPSDNIFVISHRGDQLQDKFSNILHFQKNKNFTELVQT